MELGLLQRAVAKRIGVDVTTIRNWELGHTEPAIHEMPRIVDFLGFVPHPAPWSFGERVALARRLLGLSRDALAKRLRVDPSTVWRWENGRSRPSFTLQDRLKSVLCALEAPVGRPKVSDPLDLALEVSRGRRAVVGPMT